MSMFDPDAPIPPALDPSNAKPLEWYGERYPADALVRFLKGRTVVDASCDGEGMEDVRLLLDDGTVVAVDSALEEDAEALAAARWMGSLSPDPRLTVHVGTKAKLWPADQVAGEDGVQYRRLEGRVVTVNVDRRLDGYSAIVDGFPDVSGSGRSLDELLLNVTDALGLIDTQREPGGEIADASGSDCDEALPRYLSRVVSFKLAIELDLRSMGPDQTTDQARGRKRSSHRGDPPPDSQPPQRRG